MGHLYYLKGELSVGGQGGVVYISGEFIYQKRRYEKGPTLYWNCNYLPNSFNCSGTKISDVNSGLKNVLIRTSITCDVLQLSS